MVKRFKKGDTRGLRVCVNVCEKVCVCVRQCFICTEECVFLWTGSKHRSHWTWFFLRSGEGGATMLFNKNVLFEKDKKSLAVIETFFQLVSAYFNLFLYCDGKIKMH